MATQVKPKVGTSFEKIGNLSKLQRLLICIATFALIGGVYYFAIFSSKYKILEKSKSEYEKQLAILQTTKKHASELKKYEKLMADAQERFNIAVKALPDKREVPSLLTEISKAGTNSGLVFHLFQPTAEITKEFYVEIPVSIKVEGRYHQITDFFYQIARLNRIVNIYDINIATQKDLGVMMDCKAVTYMFAEKKETEAPVVDNKKKRKKR